MRAIIVFLILLLAGPAWAGDLIARNGDDRVFLTDKQCDVPPVLALIKADFHDRWRNASATVGGKAFMACWVAVRDQVFLIYEDGDQAQIPAREFKEAPSV